MQIIKDARLPQAKKLINAIFGKSTMLKSMDVLITEDNTLVIIVFNTTIYEVKMDNCIPMPAIAFKCSDVMELEGEDEGIDDIILKDKMKYCYYYYKNIECKSPRVAEQPILRNNEEFERCISVKAADGAQFFKVPGNNIGECFMVPIFAGFPSLNKTDNIGIYVYDLQDEYKHLLIHMNIFKKKIGKDINMYFRTINIM